MKVQFYLLFLLGLPMTGAAQTASVTTPSLITAETDRRPADAPAVTFSVDANPVNNTLRLRTNAKGPMQLEINDTDGRPVLTKALVATGAPMSVPIGKALPSGTYVVRCIVENKAYTRRMTLGQ